MAEILLITAPARTKQKETIVVPPLGLAYLAAVARQAGHQVEILDAFAEGLSWEQFQQRVARRKVDVMGFTAVSPIMDTVGRAMRICRPHARILLLGGPHATVFRNTILEENPELDYAFYGEGEASFIEFLEALENGKVTADIPGIVTREGIGPPRPLCTDLDSLTFPARDLLPNDRYRYALAGTKRMTSMFTSRGCPYNCIFCDKSVFGSRWVARSAESVLAEIDEVVRKFDVESIVFYDDLFTLDRERLEAICRGLIERNYGLAWKAEGRVNIVDREALALMRRAGCDAIAYGVETASQAGLDYLRKRATPDQAREAFRLTREAGIKTMGYFLLGLPVETYEDALATIRFAIELKADYAQFNILSPFPGTDLCKEAKEKGWYAEAPVHSIHDRDRLRPVVLSENWDEANLKSIVRTAHRKFYMRPSYMLKVLARMRSLEEVANLAGLGLNMVRYLLRTNRKAA